MAEKLSYKEVADIVKSKDYILISNNYINNNTPIHINDEQGYEYKIRLSDLKENKKPRKFSNRNEYTINNIHKYLIINDIELELLSTKFIKAEEITNKFIDNLNNCNIYNDKNSCVLNFKNNLNDNILEIYKMKYVSNMSQADICRKTKLSPTTISDMMTFKRSYTRYKNYIENDLIYTPTTTKREMCYL